VGCIRKSELPKGETQHGEPNLAVSVCNIVRPTSARSHILGTWTSSDVKVKIVKPLDLPQSWPLANDYPTVGMECKAKLKRDRIVRGDAPSGAAIVDQNRNSSCIYEYITEMQVSMLRRFAYLYQHAAKAIRFFLGQAEFYFSRTWCGQ
jgi:hypothetical protein